MTEPSTPMREEFEAWWLTEGWRAVFADVPSNNNEDFLRRLIARNADGRYINELMDLRWQTWQAATLKAQAWKEAVIEACVLNHLSWDENDPLKTLTKLVLWEISIALDPKVSEAAQQLIDDATLKERERACKAICSICRGEENSYEATPEVRFVSEAMYVSNYGSIEAGWAHIGGNVEYVPCEAAAIRSDSKGEEKSNG